MPELREIVKLREKRFREPKKPAKPLPARRCKYCRANFIPLRAQDKDAKFCCPNHRKAFWRYGGLPFDKLMVRVEKEMKALVREMVIPEALKENQKTLTAGPQ
jgi:hypothetical protein